MGVFLTIDLQIPEDEIKQEEDEEQVECSKEHGDGLCGCELCASVHVSAVQEDSETEHDLTRKVLDITPKFSMFLETDLPFLNLDKLQGRRNMLVEH